ncbi:MAG: zf-HC2 domain-containing protein [Candidatus Methylomirabilales bacterium]
MDCHEARDSLPDLDRDGLPDAVSRAVRAHLTGCAECREAAAADARLRALLRERLPRHTAPADLRLRIGRLVVQPVQASRRTAGPAWWRAWRAWRPRLAPSLVGAMAAVAIVWAGGVWLAQDPLAGLIRDALREHVEYVEELMPRPAPDPRSVLDPLPDLVGFPIGPAFAGDAEIQLISGLPSEVQGKKAAALIYRNKAMQYSTLFLLPGELMIPDGARLTVQNYRPHYRLAEGRHLLLWRQNGLTHILVTDVPEAALPGMFLKIRTAA